MQVSLLGVPPDGTVVLIDRGTSVSINSITSAGTGASLIKSYNVGIITLKSLIANAPLSLAANTNDITFSIDLSAYTTTSGLTTVYTPLTRTISTTAPLTGGGALSSNLTLAIPVANGTTNGYLSSGDWTTFNNKQATLAAANGGTNGYLTAADWNTFNGKQAALGFTPVQQGTGTGQLGNTVKIGWSGNSLLAEVDVSPQGVLLTTGANVLGPSIVYDSGSHNLVLPNNYIAVQSPDSVQLYTKVIALPAWNMNSTASSSVAHGVNQDKIRSVSVIIQNDGVVDLIPVNYYDLISGNGGGFSGAATWTSSNGNISMNRVAGSVFQSTAFDSLSLSRGWVTIMYEA
jgi:hypothetical protein